LAVNPQLDLTPPDITDEDVFRRWLFENFQTIAIPEIPIEPVLENNWVNFGLPYANANFYKTADNRVHITGLVKLGILNSKIFTLPAGYIPVKREMFLQAGQIASSFTPIRIDVDDAGGVTQLNSSGVADWVSLAGISFQAAQ